MVAELYQNTHRWKQAVRAFQVLFTAIFVLMLAKQTARAQSCDLGNVVSNQTFGTGQMGALPEGYLNYIYVTDGCPNDGQYTVADSVSGSCYTRSWHSVREDHTPNDVKGNMLVLNTPYPGEIYREPTQKLCTNATYEYSFWIANISIEFPPGTCGFDIPNDPNITIRIETTDGRLIDTLNTGTIIRTKAAVWQRFSLFFTIPPSSMDVTDVVIRLVNNGVGGCGNDFVMDDMVLRQCTDCGYAAFYVPDAFTPNNDGINDVLDIYFSNVIAFEFIVYNRWGSPIFVSKDPAVKWNGKFRDVLCPEGVYTWSVNFEYSTSRKKFTKNGQVVLLH